MDTTIGACLRTDKLRVFRDHFRAVEMPNMLLLRVLIWRLGREFWSHSWRMPNLPTI